MSENAIDPAAEEPVTPADDEQTEPVETATETGPDLTAEVAKWKALSKKNEQRAKDNADKAKRLDEIEEANKSEMQKLIDRAERAETASAQLQQEVARSRVSVDTGVPVELIHGQTEEEMRASADVALAFRGSIKPPSPAAPAEIVTAGADSTKTQQITSRDELKSMTPQQILAAQKEGRLDELMGKPR